uniref:Uncharacterized protein n=1 Tax=Hucho hucho TaxID=62062 RepID=A0A4W5K6B4_9TELE
MEVQRDRRWILIFVGTLLSVANKAAEAGENQYGTSSGEAGGPPAPPTYEEATGTSEKGMSVLQKQPPYLHPSLLKVGSPCYSGAYPSDGEMLTEFSWSDKNIRYYYHITTTLLPMTYINPGLLIEPVKNYIQSNPGWYWASYAVFFVTYITLVCCPGPRWV